MLLTCRPVIFLGDVPRFVKRYLSHKLLAVRFIVGLDVIKKLRYRYGMKSPDPLLEPDWDEDNIQHIAGHGLRPSQVEELYYGEGPFPTIALENKKKHGSVTEYRYRLWGTDGSGQCIEAVIAPYPEYGVWRCVTGFPMSVSTRKAYLKRTRA